VVESEGRAREITDYRMRKRRQTLGSAGTARTLEQMMQQLKEAGRKEFPLLVKGDVQGSVEAIAGALRKIGNDEVEARIVHSGVGGVTESDIALANASKAVVIGFNVRANTQAKMLADQSGVEIRYYNIIYDLVDDVRAAMSGLLAPTLREVFLGNAQILEVFNISKVGKVAGCRVTEGKVERGAKVRLIRDNVVIHEGTLSTLKRFKDEVREVPAGQECGMAFANYQDIRAGDVIECFNVESIARTLYGLLVLHRGSARGRADPFPIRVSQSMRKHHSGKTTGPSQRQLRVGELVRHALAELLARGEIHDEVLASHVLTVPEVRMSPDLRLATIFVMPLGGKDIEAVLTALESHKRYIRGEVARAVNLKFAPEVRFRADQSFEEALRIDRLLASDKVRQDLDKR
jgi:ribosome-binding factor A